MKSDSPILGLGNDILEIERVRASHAEHGERFLERILTPKEREYCLKYSDPVPHIAARFSAKEAVAKALGTGIGKELSWHDLEILNDAKGKPLVHLSPALKQKLGGNLLIAISHSTLYVSTIALWVK